MVALPPAHFSLAAVKAGQSCRIRAVCVADSRHVQRLRELGLYEGNIVRVVTNDKRLICQVENSRLGLCRWLARDVWVEPIETAHSPGRRVECPALAPAQSEPPPPPPPGTIP